MNAVYVGTVSHRHGTNFYAGDTSEAVFGQIADYCREWWAREQAELPMPDDDETLVAEYFDGLVEEFYAVDGPVEVVCLTAS